MRTDEEILSRIDAVKGDDWIGTKQSDLVSRLPYEKAKPFLKESVTEADWTPAPRDRESLIAEMLDYMPLVWLAGDDLGDLTEYEYYGKDNLVKICNHYGWDSSQWDDGERTN